MGLRKNDMSPMRLGVLLFGVLFASVALAGTKPNWGGSAIRMTPAIRSRPQQPVVILRPTMLWSLTLSPGRIRAGTRMQSKYDPRQLGQFSGSLQLINTPALPSGNGVKLTPPPIQSMVGIDDKEIWPGGRAPKGYHWVTVTAAPGPNGATVTAVVTAGWGLKSKVIYQQSCLLAPGDFNRTRSCTITDVPPIEHVLAGDQDRKDDISVSFSVSNTVYFGEVTEGYTATPKSDRVLVK